MADNDNNKISSGSVFKIIFIVLIGIGIVAIINGSSIKSFSSLLQFLSDAPTINMDWNIQPFVNLDFPSWLGWLETIATFLSYLVSFAWTLILSAFQAIIYLYYILRWIFL